MIYLLLSSFGPGVYTCKNPKSADTFATSSTSSPYRVMICCEVLSGFVSGFGKFGFRKPVLSASVSSIVLHGSNIFTRCNKMINTSSSRIHHFVLPNLLYCTMCNLWHVVLPNKESYNQRSSFQ